jgi:hypothetical protein
VKEIRLVPSQLENPLIKEIGVKKITQTLKMTFFKVEANWLDQLLS